MRVPLLALVASCAFAACVTVVHTLPSVGPSAAPQKKLGYVAASFSVAPDTTGTFTFVLVDGGDYRVAYWRRGLGGEAAKLLPLKSENPLAEPFALRPGHVVFLGRFRAREQRWTDMVSWSIEPDVPRADEAWTIFRTAYPGLTRGPGPVGAANPLPEVRAPRSGAFPAR